MSLDVTAVLPDRTAWTQRHLLDLESLTAEEITLILDTADHFKEITDGCRKKLTALSGYTCCNLFFENSTRTRTSFSLAARRLGADTVEFFFIGEQPLQGRDVHRHGEES